MQQKQRLAVGIGASLLALTVGVGAALAAGPHGPLRASAATGTPLGGTVAADYGSAYGGGYGSAYGGGYGAGAGTGAQARTQSFAAALAQPGGTLTADQQARLAGLAVEEKLALDVYTWFSGQYSTPVWKNIAASEATHLTTVRTLLARYGIADPTAGRAVGDYASLDMVNLYRSLLAQGAGSEAAAWAVGVTIESDDIAKVDFAASSVTAPDATAVYASLRSASEQHLASFNRLIDR